MRRDAAGPERGQRGNSRPLCHTGTMTAGPTAPTTSKSNQVIVILLVIIAVLLAAIAAFVARGMTSQDPSPQAGATASGPTAASSGGPSAAETSAPTQTDEQTLSLIRSQARRDPSDGQARGEADAPVVMVLYSDFACPYCTLFAQEVAPELEDLVADGTLRIEWRDLAQITETSPLAAQAGIAAAKQGRFWEFHDAVYTAADPQGHPEYTEDSLVDFAQKAGVPDLEAFRTEMTAPETVEAVTASTHQAYSIGIQGTPFMLVGDTYISGYRPAEYVRATVLEQAALAEQ